MKIFGCIKKKRTKFILSLISSIFNVIGHGVLPGTSGIKVYILSYIHYKYSWVDMQYGNLMMPLMTFSLSLFSPLSGPLVEKFGPIIPVIISAIIIEISLFLFYLQQNIWYFYGISLLAGIGSGLSANILLRNTCFYYPKRKGLISAIIMSFMGLCLSLYSLLGEQIVNPDKVQAESDDRYYYPIEVAKNVKKYFIFAMIVLPICTALTILLFYQYDPKCEEEEGEEKNIENSENLEKKEEMNAQLINNKKDPKLNSFYKPSPKRNIKIALKNFRFWRNIMIAGLLPLYISFIRCTFRAYVVMIKVDPDVIYYLGFSVALISCIFGPIWASLVDKFGFQPIMKIIGILISAMSVYFFFFIDDDLFYVIGLFFIIAMLVGIMASMTPHLMNIYGMRYYLIIGGFARLFNDLSSFIVAIISIVISFYCKTAEELKVPYQIVIASGGILSLIGLTMVFFENDEKFIYGDENNDNKYFKKEDDNTPSDNTFEKDKNDNNAKSNNVLNASNTTEESNE